EQRAKYNMLNTSQSSIVEYDQESQREYQAERGEKSRHEWCPTSRKKIHQEAPKKEGPNHECNGSKHEGVFCGCENALPRTRLLDCSRREASDNKERQTDHQKAQ